MRKLLIGLLLLATTAFAAAPRLVDTRDAAQMRGLFTEAFGVHLTPPAENAQWSCDAISKRLSRGPAHAVGFSPELGMICILDEVDDGFASRVCGSIEMKLGEHVTGSPVFTCIDASSKGA